MLYYFCMHDALMIYIYNFFLQMGGVKPLKLNAMGFFFSSFSFRGSTSYSNIAEIYKTK